MGKEDKVPQEKQPGGELTPSKDKERIVLQK